LGSHGQIFGFPLFDEAIFRDEDHVVDLDFGFPVVSGEGIAGADEVCDLSQLDLHVEGLVLDG
jgi:hypothetical protein